MSQISGKLKQVFLKNCPVFSAKESFIQTSFPAPTDEKTFPQNDTPTTVLHYGNGILGVMGSFGFVPHIVFPMMSSILMSFDQRIFFHVLLGK